MHIFFIPLCLSLHFSTYAIILLCKPNFPFFFLQSKTRVCLFSTLPFVSDWQLRSHSRYSCIPSFCCGVAMNQVCEMEMRSLSLSASLSFQTSKRGYASNVFLRSWSAAKSYKWSRERERERWRKRVSRMQRKERGRRTKR